MARTHGRIAVLLVPEGCCSLYGLPICGGKKPVDPCNCGLPHPTLLPAYLCAPHKSPSVLRHSKPSRGVHRSRVCSMQTTANSLCNRAPTSLFPFLNSTAEESFPPNLAVDPSPWAAYAPTSGSRKRLTLPVKFIKFGAAPRFIDKTAEPELGGGRLFRIYAAVPEPDPSWLSSAP